MDLDALRIFLKVAELGSITRAGAQLGLSKSRVSRRVNALERELDAHLFHRTTRAVRLTADGEALLPRARRIVREGDEIGALFHTGRGLRGQVRVDLPVKIARRVILPALPELLLFIAGLLLLVLGSLRERDAARLVTPLAILSLIVAAFVVIWSWMFWATGPSSAAV